MHVTEGLATAANCWCEPQRVAVPRVAGWERLSGLSPPRALRGSAGVSEEPVPETRGGVAGAKPAAAPHGMCLRPSRWTRLPEQGRVRRPAGLASTSVPEVA